MTRDLHRHARLLLSDASHGLISLGHCETKVVLQTYDEESNQTICTTNLASTDSNMLNLDALSLKISSSALSSQLIPSIPESNPADSLAPQQDSSFQRSCDDTGLQSSLRWTEIQLDSGRAILLV